MIADLFELLERHGAKHVGAAEHRSKIDLQKPVLRHEYSFGPPKKPDVADALSHFSEHLSRLAEASDVKAETQGRKVTYSGSGFKVVFDPGTFSGGSYSPHHVKIYLERALAEEHLSEKSRPVLRRIDEASAKGTKDSASAKRAHEGGIRRYGGYTDWRRRQ